MNPPLRVALHGFSDFERRALGSFFRLAAPPTLALEQVGDPAAADVIVGDAEHADAVAQLRALGRLGDTVFIGPSAPEGAAARLSRPIDALHVIREIEALMARRHAARPQPPDSPATSAAHGASDPSPATGPGASAGSAGSAAAHQSRPGFMLLEPEAPSPAPPSASGRPSALLVDDSAIALRYLQLRLQRLGIDADLASGSGPALEMLAQRAYGYVFIDVELGTASPLDGLALCQHIKRQHHHVEGRAPVLVMVSAHHGEVDRARGTFAGCDHYLAKPAEDKALLALLSQARPKPAPRAARR